MPICVRRLKNPIDDLEESMNCPKCGSALIDGMPQCICCGAVLTNGNTRNAPVMQTMQQQKRSENAANWMAALGDVPHKLPRSLREPSELLHGLPDPSPRLIYEKKKHEEGPHV